MLGHWLTKTMLQEITRSSKDECSTGDQTIILGLQILIHERSSSMLYVDKWMEWMVIIGHRSSKSTFGAYKMKAVLQTFQELEEF